MTGKRMLGNVEVARRVFDTSWTKPATVHRNAKPLLDNRKITARIAELCERSTTPRSQQGSRPCAGSIGGGRLGVEANPSKLHVQGVIATAGLIISLAGHWAPGAARRAFSCLESGGVRSRILAKRWTKWANRASDTS
jgi:hypothetical protein